MKYPWLAIALSLPTLPAFADIHPEDIIFYAGFAAGGAYNSAEISKQTHTVTTDPNDIILSQGTLPYSGDSAHFSGVGQVQLGAGLRFDSLYLGIEALGQLSNGDFDTVSGMLDFHGIGMDVPSSTFGFDMGLKMNSFEPAIDFKPGWFLSHQTLLYARIGAAFNELTLTENAHYDIVDGRAIADVNASKSENLVALRTGLGVEHHLNQRLHLFMDYTFTNYGDLSLHTNEMVDANLGEFTLHFDIDSQNKADDITKQVVMIGLNYYL